MPQYYFAMTTLGNEKDAARVAKELVSRRLVACANVIPGLRSFYHWKGELCDEQEWLITMKTTAEQVAAIKQALPELHPYDEPELIFLPIEDGSETYLKWITSEISSSHPAAS